MKSLKFRVWSGNMFLDSNDFTLKVTDRDSTDVEIKATYPHKDLIICLSTGLKDKNGKEIYESDLVKSENGDVGEVIWKGERYWREVIKHGIKSLHPIRYSSTLEVIGNIYENSNLLK